MSRRPSRKRPAGAHRPDGDAAEHIPGAEVLVPVAGSRKARQQATLDGRALAGHKRPCDPEGPGSGSLQLVQVREPEAAPGRLDRLLGSKQFQQRQRGPIRQHAAWSFVDVPKRRHERVQHTHERAKIAHRRAEQF